MDANKSTLKDTLYDHKLFFIFEIGVFLLDIY